MVTDFVHTQSKFSNNVHCALFDLPNCQIFPIWKVRSPAHRSCGQQSLTTFHLVSSIYYFCPKQYSPYRTPCSIKLVNNTDRDCYARVMAQFDAEIKLFFKHENFLKEIHSCIAGNVPVGRNVMSDSS